MRIVRHGTARDFLARALPWLLEAEVQNNLILGIALGCARREATGAGGTDWGDPPPWFATAEAEGRVQGAAFRTPPHMLGLTPLPAMAVELLAEAVDRTFDTLPGVVGEPGTADALAASWTRRRGVRAGAGMDMAIHRLTTLRWPANPAPGALRVAGPGDLPLLTRWMATFEADTGIFSTGAEALVRKMVAEEALFLWEVDGRPVSMAGMSGATPNAARISYVFTPRDDRGRGYAAMATASVTRRILDGGHRWAVLYTDLADPVANRLYARLGYEPVAAARTIRFGEDPAPGDEGEDGGTGAQ